MADDYLLQSTAPPSPPVRQLTQFLRRGGKRMTRQRRLIVEEVFSHHDHFDADELMEHLKELIARREVSRPTVYRTLGELVEAGLLRKMTLGGRGVYEHEYGYPSHDHLHCDICNRLIEFRNPEMQRLRDEVAREYDFKVIGHRMFINGICRECQSSRNSGE